MSRCVLFPHEYDDLPGVGEYAGRRYRVCIHCGKTEPITDTGMSDSSARNGTPLSRPTMPGSASPKARCAEDPVNRPDLESSSAEIVGTCSGGFTWKAAVGKLAMEGKI